MTDRDTLMQILDLARWAPSGDNTQPWRFEILGDAHIAVHGFDTREHVVYDFDGHASHMAHGALLETLRIAATGFGLAAEWSIRPGCPDSAPVYDVRLRPDAAIEPDSLIPFIKTRVTQRRPMKMTPLLPAQREALARASGPGFEVVFFESFAERLRVARLLWDNAKIRLTCPEAYAVHRDVIEWGARFSEDRIPEQAVGVDPVTARLMRWVMQSWERVDFFNRYMLGTVAPRVQLDLLPALCCAGHLLLRPKSSPSRLEDYVGAGSAMQRLWLTGAAMGLHLQPEMTPVIFHWYARAGRPVSVVEHVNVGVRMLLARFEQLSGSGRSDAFVFLCRFGHSSDPVTRSVRLPLPKLIRGHTSGRI